MAAKDGDVVWFYDQYSLQLSTVAGYQPLKGKVLRVIPHATAGLTTVDVLTKDPALPPSRNNVVKHNVAYIPAGGVTPLKGLYAVADKGDGTGPAAVTPETPTNIAPPAPPAMFKPAKGDVTEAPGQDGTISHRATGLITVTALPSANDTLTVNGVVYTFKASPAAATDIGIAGTTAAQATAIAAALTASTDARNTVASYAANASTVAVQYKQAGAVGNAFTLAESSAGLTVSGATLTGGTDGGPSSEVNLG